MNTGVKLELDTITMFTGPQYARNREMECMFTTKVFTREQHCNIQIKEEYETCALKCLYRNDYDMLKKHMDSKHEMLRVGLLNLGNVNLNTSLKNVIARYGSVVEQVRGISVPNSGKEAFWNEKLLSVFTGTDLEYYICACDKNTADKVIRDIALSSAYNRFINVNEEFAYCFSGISGGKVGKMAKLAMKSGLVLFSLPGFFSYNEERKNKKRGKLCRKRFLQM